MEEFRGGISRRKKLRFDGGFDANEDGRGRVKEKRTYACRKRKDLEYLSMSRAYETYHFTLPVDGQTDANVRRCLLGFAAKFFFQREILAPGYERYRGTFIMREKRPIDRTKDVCEGFGLKDVRLEPSGSKPVFFAGESGDCSSNANDLNFRVPCDVIEPNQMYPWQREVCESIEVYDARTIDIVVYDPNARQGKTALTKMLVSRRYDAMVVPVLASSPDERVGDLRRHVLLDENAYRCYVIEPSFANHAYYRDKLREAVESLKDGHLRDPKGTLEGKSFRPPRLWVFVRTFPDESVWNSDRYRIWTINSDRELIPHPDAVRGTGPRRMRTERDSSGP